MTKSQQKSFRSIQTILSNNPKSHQAYLLTQNQSHSSLLATIQELLPDSSQAHCLSAQLKYDDLIVHTDSSAWAAKLRFQLATLLPTLRRQAGYHAATKVTIRIQPPQASGTKKHTVKNMDQQTAQQIRELAVAIRDETLRQTWLKLANNAEADPELNNPDN
ncbi:MAG: DUF721 domain-containing protein [Sulfuriflexus sp.]|nr:DUF721 domain-containing protein [Sulfuriflexus sp.]